MGRLQKNKGRNGLVSSNVFVSGRPEIDHNSVEMDRQHHPRDPRVQQNQKRPAAPIDPNIAMDKRMTRWEPGVDFGKLVSLFSSNKKDTKPSKPPQPELPSLFANPSRPQPNRNQAVGSSSSQYATASSNSDSRAGRVGAGISSGRNPMRQPEAFTTTTISSGSSGYPPVSMAADRKGKGVVGFGGLDGRPDQRALGAAVPSPLSQNPSFPYNGQAGPGPNTNTNSRMDNRILIDQDAGLRPAPFAGKGKEREDSVLRPAGNLARKPLAASSFAEREAQMANQRGQQQQQTSNPAFPAGARDPDCLPIRNNRDVRVPVPEIRVTEPRASLEKNPPARELRAAKVQPSAAAKVVDIKPGKGVDDRRQQLRDNSSNSHRPEHGLGISTAQKAPATPFVESGQRVPNRSEMTVQNMPLPKDSVKTSGASERVDYKLDTRTGQLVPVTAERRQESRSQQTQQNSSWSPFPNTHQRKKSNSQTIANTIAEEQSRNKAKGKQREVQDSRSESQQVGQSAGVYGGQRNTASFGVDQAALRQPERPAVASHSTNPTQGQTQAARDARASERPSESSIKDVNPRIQNQKLPSTAQRQPPSTQSHQPPQRVGGHQTTNAETVPSSLRPSQPQRVPVSSGREKSFAEHSSASQQRTREPLLSAAGNEPAKDKNAARELPFKQTTREEQKRTVPAASLMPATSSAKVTSRDRNEEQGLSFRQTSSKDQPIYNNSQNLAKTAIIPEKTGAPIPPHMGVEASAPVTSKSLSENPRSAPGPQKSQVVDEQQRRRPANEQDNRVVQNQTRPDNKARETAETPAQAGSSRDKNVRDNGPQRSAQPEYPAYGGQLNDAGFRQARERPRVEIPRDDKNLYQAFKPSHSDRQQGASNKPNTGSASSREGRGAHAPGMLREDTTGQDSPKPLSLGTRDALAQMLRKEAGPPRVGRGTQQADSPLDDNKRYQAFSPIGAARPSLPDQRFAESTRRAGALGAGPEKERREASQSGNRESSPLKSLGIEKNATLGQTDSRTRETEQRSNVPGVLAAGKPRGEQATAAVDAKSPQKPLQSRPNGADLASGSQSRGMEKSVPSRDTGALSSDTRSKHNRDPSVRKAVGPPAPSSRSLEVEKQPSRPVGSSREGHIGGVVSDQNTPAAQPKSSATKTSISPLAALERMAERRSLDYVQTHSSGEKDFGGSQNTSKPRVEESADTTQRTVPVAVDTGVERPQKATQGVVRGREVPATETFAVKDDSRTPTALSYSTSNTRFAPQLSSENADKSQLSRPPRTVLAESRERSSQDSSTPTQRGASGSHHRTEETKKDRGLIGSSSTFLEQQPVKEVTIRAPPRPQHAVLVTKGTSQDNIAPVFSTSTGDRMAAARASVVPDVVQVPWTERYLPTASQRSAELAPSVPNVRQRKDAATDGPLSKDFTQPRSEDGPRTVNDRQHGAWMPNTSAESSGGAWKVEDDSISGTPVASHKRGFWDLYSGSNSKGKNAEGLNIVRNAQPPRVKPERPAAPTAQVDRRNQKSATVSDDHAIPTEQGLAAPLQQFAWVQGENAIPDCLIVPSPTRTSPPTPFGLKAAGSEVIDEPTKKAPLPSVGLGERQVKTREGPIVSQVPVMAESKLPSETVTASTETRGLVFPFPTQAAQQNNSATLVPVHEQQPDLTSYLKHYLPMATSTSASPAVSNAVPANNVTVAETAAARGLSGSSKSTDATSRRKSNRMASMYGSQLNFGYDQPMPSIMPKDNLAQSPLSRPLDFDTLGSREPAVVKETAAVDIALSKQAITPEIRLEDPKTDELLVRDDLNTLLPQTSTPTGQKVGRPATPKPSRVAHGSLLAIDTVPPIPGIDESEPLRKSQLPAPLSLKVNDVKEANNHAQPIMTASIPASMDTRDPKPSLPATVDHNSRDEEVQHSLSTLVSTERKEEARGPFAASSTPMPQPATSSNLEKFLGEIFKNEDIDRVDDVSLLDNGEIASSVSGNVKLDKDEVKRHDIKQAEMMTRSVAAEDSSTLSLPAEAVVGQQTKAGEVTDAPPSFWNRLKPTTQLHRGTGKNEHANMDFDPEGVHEAGHLSLGAEEKHEGSSKDVVNAPEPSVSDSADKLPLSLENFNSRMMKNASVESDSMQPRLTSSSKLSGADQNDRSGPAHAVEQKTSPPASSSMDALEMSVDSPETLPLSIVGTGEGDQITPPSVFQHAAQVPAIDGFDLADKVEVHEAEKVLTPSSLSKSDRALSSSPSPSDNALTTPAKADDIKEVEEPFTSAVSSRSSLDRKSCQKEEAHGVVHSPLEFSAAIQDPVFAPEVSVATKHRSDNGNDASMPSSYGKDMYVQGEPTSCSPTIDSEQPALQALPKKELPVSSSSLGQAVVEHYDVPISQADDTRLSMAVPETSRGAHDDRSVGESESLPPSASMLRSVSPISESTKHLDTTPASSGTGNTTTSSVLHGDGFSPIHRGDAQPEDEQSCNGRGSVSPRQPIDVSLTNTLSSHPSASPSLGSPTLYSRSIDATNNEGVENVDQTKLALGLQKERHISLDESDCAKARDAEQLHLEATNSTGINQLLAVSPATLASEKVVAESPEKTDHGMFSHAGLPISCR